MPNFDAIIIGAGQSGPALARRLVAAGRKVAVIERKLFGGTCVNTGCTPTKTLIASAYTAHVARRAADYGVRIEGPINVDMKAVKARKDTVVDVFRNGLERSLKTLEGCTVYEGHGRFVAEKKVVVNGSEPRGRPDFHQCRRARRDSTDSRSRPSSVPDQQLDDGHRFPPPTSGDHGR
jgi:pyruvate/2-oxoglutarate dehydrogenase complex dihydrolipoamide dehydrogenase (E3) component